jgi:hypothetical protein
MADSETDEGKARLSKNIGFRRREYENGPYNGETLDTSKKSQGEKAVSRPVGQRPAMEDGRPAY